ncbi:MAG: alpha/beta hydrolase [Betaproteobacteria bacterium]
MSRVFLDYDQKALDDAYDQSVYAPNREQLLARFAQASELARKRLGAPQRLAYGTKPNEKLDVFTSKKPNAPVNVFVHGGAWRAGEAKNYAWPAEMFVRAGSHYVALDFDNVLETEGDLLPMAEQVRRALAWVFLNCSKFGGDPQHLYVSATSSGAHLAGCAAITDWKKDFNLPPDFVKGYVLVSGMYDLRGPRLSKRSAYVKFTDAMEMALSPRRHAARVAAPVVLVYGSLETPEFQRQSREFADALRQAGKPVSLILAEGYNHFEIADTLGNPYGPVGRAVLEQMKL